MKTNYLILEEPVAGNLDVRWRQRLSNFRKAFMQLERFVDKGSLNELEQQGLIKAFEYTFELSWNVIKDFYSFQGVSGIQGSRDAIRLAFRRGLVEDGEGWMDMLKSRIESAHTYEEEKAVEIADAIFARYYFLFSAFLIKMEGIHR